MITNNTIIATEKIKNTCKIGHTFYKSSDCPTCPTCETLKEPASELITEQTCKIVNGKIYELKEYMDTQLASI